jgi:hypothetical protein
MEKKGLKENLGKWLLIIFVLLWFSFLVLFPLWGIISETVKSGWKIFIASLAEPAALHDRDVLFAITRVGELHVRYELLVKTFGQDSLVRHIRQLFESPQNSFTGRKH